MGRADAAAGYAIDRNPAGARTAATDGTPDTDDAWNAKKTAWQRGWDSFHADEQK